MKIQWTSHLKEDDDKDWFQKQVLAAKPVLERLDTLVTEKLKALESIEVGMDKYIQPGWSAMQAHCNGEKAAWKYIKNLINLQTERENKDGRQPL